MDKTRKYTIKNINLRTNNYAHKRRQIRIFKYETMTRFKYLQRTNFIPKTFQTKPFYIKTFILE